MVDGRTHDIPLAEARLLIQRAIDKAEQLQLRGGVAVYGGSGALVSASRMDRGGAGGMARARSKAWISATQQIPSAEHLKRMNFVSAPVEQGFKTASPEALFPGAGGMPIYRPLPGGGDEVVGGIAASGATVSPFFPAGIAQENMIANGQPANPEDLLIHYALGLPYVGQHGDDYARWNASFGEFPKDAPEGLGMADAPRASRQFEHEWALTLADAVIREAEKANYRIALAVVDQRGDAIQQDAMDGAPTSAAFLALSVAATAATFQMLSGVVSAKVGQDLPGIRALLPFPILTVDGGIPIFEDGGVVGALGVSGEVPAACIAIARAAIDSIS
ncbi:MAG TPA: heme-binding protein [Galbitalea sp.]|nr:heme-binding protein [Galbitalea sp.]